MKKFPIILTIIAVLLGIILSFMVIILFENIMSKYWASPITNPSIAEYENMIKHTSTKVFLIFISGHALSSFFGSYLASRIAPHNYKLISGFIIGFFLLLGGIVLFFSINFPLWVGISTCISYLLFSFLAIKINLK